MAPRATARRRSLGHDKEEAEVSARSSSEGTQHGEAEASRRRRLDSAIRRFSRSRKARPHVGDLALPRLVLHDVTLRDFMSRATTAGGSTRYKVKATRS